MKYFLVYNDYTHTKYLDKLLKSVRQYSDFEIIIFNKDDIDKDFISNNQLILNQRRGGGYWLWKPYIISETLKKLNDNDIIFYLDSKYYFTEEFTDLYKDIYDTDILVWSNKPNECCWFMKNWCKMDVIKKYNMYNKVFTENVIDVWAGCICIRKTENSIKYINKWLSMCCIPEDITDSPSIEMNHTEFREHRHDQSLLSIIVHKYNIRILYFEKKYLQNVRSSY